MYISGGGIGHTYLLAAQALLVYSDQNEKLVRVQFCFDRKSQSHLLLYVRVHR